MKKIIIISLFVLLGSLIFISPASALSQCVDTGGLSRGCTTSPTGCTSGFKDIGQLDCPAGSICCESISPSSSPSPAPGGSPSSSGSGGGTSVSFGGLSPLGESTDVPTVIGNVVKAVLGVVGALALFMVVYGGIFLLSSAGSQEKIKKGKDIITWSVIGVMVVLGSYVLVDFVIRGIQGEGQGSNGGGQPADTRCEDSGTGAELWACMDLMEFNDGSCSDADSALECANKLGFNCKTGLCPGGKWNVCCEWQVP